MPEYKLTVVLVDDYNRKSRKVYESVPDLADFATARTSADALIADLKAVSGMRVLRSYLSEMQVETDSAAAGVSKDSGITLSVRKSNTFETTLTWPGPVAAYILTDGSVDIEDSLITDYVANFLDPTGDWTVSDGEQVTDIISGSLDE